MTAIITVKDLHKKFRLFTRNIERVKEIIHPFRKKYHHEFWALNNINFEIEKGETVGIIGQNGSGKSTLLQILSGVMSPTLGEVKTKGRISALLELGTGFDNELTGRENLYLSGSILGFSKKEIQKKIPLIEKFADIGDFFDQPVKIYSSGMYVRLAFSVAIHVDPEILIVDEALAVGDVKFQNKCYRKFNEFKTQNKTIIFVTHSTELITKHCDRAILLNNGSLVMDAKPNEVVNYYFELMFGVKGKNDTNNDKQKKNDKSEINIPEFKELNKFPNQVMDFLSKKSKNDECLKNPLYNKNEHRYGNQKAKVVDFLVFSDNECNPPQIKAHEKITIYIKYYFSNSIKIPIYGFMFKTLDGIEILGSHNLAEKISVKEKKMNEYSFISFELPASFTTGEYFINIGLAEIENNVVIPVDRRYDMIHIKISNPTERFGISDLNISMAELDY